MDKYLACLYANDFEKLKVCFYQLERLIGIILPNLAEHFKVKFITYTFLNQKEEALDSSYYATPWILTVFTSCF